MSLKEARWGFCSFCSREVEIERGTRQLSYHSRWNSFPTDPRYSRAYQVVCEGSLKDPEPTPTGEIEAIAFTTKEKS